MDAHTILVEQLKQRCNGANVTEQARKLKISQPHLWQVIHGEKRLGQDSLNKIRVNCPELASLAIAALMETQN
jgi:hypothetical protein